ncbi:hypothetical protein GUJ93_ZPchr0004g38881 [Zizania palustris]|uniref:Uncharacterized protein n=1 Tax=Zizania palustris TaxID=103762 RepID=A0A8J5VGC3_ZIZPA|nr:hypothetical protein GUJ93_ZPchr0004g38881 [Zizania palustris]
MHAVAGGHGERAGTTTSIASVASRAGRPRYGAGREPGTRRARARCNNRDDDVVLVHVRPGTVCMHA